MEFKIELSLSDEDVERISNKVAEKIISALNEEEIEDVSNEELVTTTFIPNKESQGN